MLNFLAAIGSAPAGGGGGSFESIATATGTGSSGTITFSSIPSTYQHLQIRCLTKVTNTGVGAATLELRFNGVSTSTYAAHGLRGYFNGSSYIVDAFGAASQTSTYAGYALAGSLTGQTNMLGASIIDIHDYASTTKNKTVRWFAGTELNSNESGLWLGSGLFNSTAAITSITLFASSNFTTSTQFALYGIKGA